jgi:hypothetical protein
MRTYTETEYLDLDGDGLPDAVRTVITLELGGDAVERVETLEWGIGDDGTPRAEFISGPTLAVAA